jgi:glutathione synthase/RimK-type ligase-like ATP-grasp enzyme
MTLNENSETSYFTEIAKRAAIGGVTCYRFIPSNIHPVTQVVTGSIFDTITGEWNKTEFAIPNILYDRCFYGEDIHSNQCMSIVSWLKSRNDIFFLGYGLPNKLELYNVLKQSPLVPYLPPTKLISISSTVLDELSVHKRIVLKPVNGSQGNGIFYIELQTLTYIVKTFNKNQHILREFRDQKKFRAWIESLLAKKSYLIQPYLELINENEEPFDIRILLQKGKDGCWQERGRGIRVGHPDGILSNLSAGGHIVHYDAWKEHYSSYQLEFIETEIIDILEKIPTTLEETFLPLFELGIDIGIAKTGSIWILDINSKPGRKVLLETSPEKQEDIYISPILYGKTLANSENNERKRYDAKTLSY